MVAAALRVSPAAILLGFDPVLRLGSLSVRWQALGLSAAIVIALAAWVLELRRHAGPAVRFDDAAFILLGAIPGAVVGGRVVHGLAYTGAYMLEPVALLDLGRGSLSLLGAVIGGALTAGYVCRLLGQRVGPWADAAAVPLLLGIGLGKLAMLLGGAGQGVAADAPWAVAFAGPGPWWSEDPDAGAVPSQILEGAWCLLGVVPVWLLGQRLGGGRSSGRGRVLLAAVAWWLAGRAAIAVTWRDEPILGPLGIEGLAAAVVAAVAIAALARLGRRLQPFRTAGPQNVRG
jgi:prolipoprotein diacylglyceryltransferase